MYAVNLDADCLQVKPTYINVEAYILEQSRIVEAEFLPILAKL